MDSIKSLQIRTMYFHYTACSCTYIRESASKNDHKSYFVDQCAITQGLASKNDNKPAMKSASLYVFIALGALLISHSSAAPMAYDLAKLGKEFIKILVSSTNEQAIAEAAEAEAEAEAAEAEAEAAREAAHEAEFEKADLIGKQVDALIQVAFDGMNEVLAIAQDYLEKQGKSSNMYELQDSFRK